MNLICKGLRALIDDAEARRIAEGFDPAALSTRSREVLERWRSEWPDSFDWTPRHFGMMTVLIGHDRDSGAEDWTIREKIEGLIQDHASEGRDMPPLAEWAQVMNELVDLALARDPDERG